MKNITQHPRAAGLIAAIFRRFKKSYAFSGTATWRNDGLWVEGLCDSDGFEGLIDYNDDGNLEVQHFCTWTNLKR